MDGEVLRDLIILSKFYFDKSTLPVCNFVDVSIGDKKLSTILGDLIWEEVSRCIIHECLVHSIPNNSSELEKYSTVRP